MSNLVTRFTEHVSKGRTLASTDLSEALATCSKAQKPHLSPQQLPNKAQILTAICKPAAEEKTVAWSRQELASLLFNVYHMGEGDWKSITVEDPSGGQEKKTPEQIMRKVREVKYLLRGLYHQKVLPDCTDINKYLIPVMLALLHG